MRKVGGTRFNGALSVLGPSVGVQRGSSPKSGDEFNVLKPGRRTSPVVTPRNLRARGEAVGKLGIIVRNSALAVTASLAIGARASGGRGAGRARRATVADIDVDVLVGGGESHGSGRRALPDGRGGARRSRRRVCGLGHCLSLGAVGSRGSRVGRGGRLAGREDGRGLRRAGRLDGSDIGRGTGGDSDRLLDSGGDGHVTGASRGRIGIGSSNLRGELDVGDNGGLASGSNGSSSGEASTSWVETSAVGVGVRVDKAGRLVVVVLCVAMSVVGNGESSGGEGQNAHGVDRGHCDGGLEKTGLLLI